MLTLILINGQGGSGKTATAKQLLRQIEPAAYIETDSLISVNPFEFDQQLETMGIENTKLLLQSFHNAGYRYVIMCGLFSNQAVYDKFVSSLEITEYQALYVWLRADKAIRDQRRIGRARDEGDSTIYFEALDKLLPDLDTPLLIRNGQFIAINNTHMTPDETVHIILQNLA